MTDSPTGRSPEALASLIAVNITPLAGIFFLGWPPAGVLISYFVDTFVGLCVVMTLLMIHVTGDEQATPIAGWRRWSRLVAAVVFLGALIVLPLAIPVLAVLGSDVIVQTLLESSSIQLGLAVQVLMSVLASLRVHRQLEATHDDDRMLSGRFLFLNARWVAIFLAVATGLVSLVGPRLGSFVLIAIYAGASIYFEMFPQHAMRFVRAGNPKPIAYEGDLASRAAKKQGDKPRAP